MDLIEKLEKEIAAGTESHAYLFISNSRIKAEEAVATIIRGKKCLPEDIVVIDTDIRSVAVKKTDKKESNEIKAEMVREFIRQLSLSSYHNGRIGIIWWSERLNPVSANILLKTLEEPPNNATLILISSTENILPTIKSRCRVYKTQNNESVKDHTFSYDEIIISDLSVSFKKIEALVKDARTESFIDQMLVHYQEKMVKSADVNLERFLEKIFVAKKRVKGNANKRLVLENLILEAKKIDG